MFIFRINNSNAVFFSTIRGLNEGINWKIKYYVFGLIEIFIFTPFTSENFYLIVDRVLIVTYWKFNQYFQTGGMNIAHRKNIHYSVLMRRVLFYNDVLFYDSSTFDFYHIKRFIPTIRRLWNFNLLQLITLYFNTR